MKALYQAEIAKIECLCAIIEYGFLISPVSIKCGFRTSITGDEIPDTEGEEYVKEDADGNN